MPKIPSRKTKQYRIIEAGISVGMSGNEIQKLLRENSLGIRRKTLFAEIRSIKAKGLTKKQQKIMREKYEKKRIKYTPKKPSEVRKEKWKEKALKMGQIYRGSLIISSVPLHSTPFNRRYLGFRLNIFSYDKKTVYDALDSMKEKFIEMCGEKKRLESRPYAKESYEILGTEKVVKINVTNPNSLNGKWFFAVEEKGSDIDSESGYI